jgi:hypothetical protein
MMSMTIPRRHVVSLPRARVARLYKCLWERGRMAATHRAAREYKSFANYFGAILKGDRGIITIEQSLPWFRHLWQLAGDAELAFEVGRQIHAEADE